MDAWWIDNTILIKTGVVRKKVDNSIVTDAVFSATMYDSDGAVVAGIVAVPLTHLGGGVYYAEVLPDQSLIEFQAYTLNVICSNYIYSAQETRRALHRTFAA